MLVDWIATLALLVVGTYLLANARQLGSRPRRGTEARFSARTWTVAGVIALVGAAAGVISIIVG